MEKGKEEEKMKNKRGSGLKGARKTMVSKVVETRLRREEMEEREIRRSGKKGRERRPLHHNDYP